METPFFTYQGSKASIRKWILPFMPESGRMYVEPFAGRGNMFFLARQKLKFSRWLLNDTSTYVFLRHIQGRPGEGIDTSWLPETMTWELFKGFKDAWEADKFNYRSLVIEPGIAHLGHYRSGWMGKYTRTRPWSKEKYGDRLRATNELLKGVDTLGVSWQTLLGTCDGLGRLYESDFHDDDFMYFDPPYLDTEHRYYDDIDHPRFLNELKKLKCRWLLSHTDHPLYREALGEPFEVKVRKPGGKAVGRVAGNVIRECLWRNY